MTGIPGDEGTFDPIGYASLLAAVHRNQVSGLLTLSSPGQERKLYLDNGHVIFASSSRPEDRLGDVLLKHGVITREQFDRSSTLIRETGKKQGTLLVQMGAVNPKELFRGLLLQVTEIARGPFAWPGGSYTFATGYDRSQEMIVLKLHPGNIIREGIWSAEIPPDKLPGSDLVFRAAAKPSFSLEELPLSPLEKKILAGAAKGVSSGQMAAATGIPVTAVARNFLVLSLLDLVTATGEERAAAAKETAPAPDDHTREKRRQEVIDLYQGLNGMTHYQILGLGPRCTPAEVKRAYIARARDFHPDRFARPGLDDLSQLANQILMRVNEAHAVLSDDAQRRAYNASLTVSPERLSTPAAESDLALAARQYRKGMQLLKCEEPHEAVEAFRWAVRLHPENPRYHAAVGQALLHTGRRLKEAEEHLRSAISLDPDASRYHLMLGRLYAKGRALRKAAEAFERVLKLDPGNTEASSELKKLSSADEAPERREEPSFLHKLFGK